MMLSITTFMLLAANASAHTIFTQLHVNGIAQGHLKGVRVPVRPCEVYDYLFRVVLT
jgi:hypothetical protein